MDIHQATEEYEAWLRACLPAVIEEDLQFKHQQMATSVFPFLRATFYRWAQRWPQLCPHLAAAPTVLRIGDLHVENYGTWRDDEGRLVWGINHFDEVPWLPYPAERDEKALLHSMGFEVANVHLASLSNALGERRPAARVGDVLDDLADRNSRHADWLVTAAQRLAADTRGDWGHWKG